MATTKNGAGRMATQTVIVAKTNAATRAEAAKIARAKTGKQPTTSRETSTSYRFRQRPPGDFVRGSFRTIAVGDGVSLVRGRLKKPK